MIPPARLIVTADDFGLDARVNEAIARSFEQGLITFASLMVNLDGFEDARRLIRTHRLEDRIGLHLNLTQGAPLTTDIRQTPFCANGGFVGLNRARYYRIVDAATRVAVAKEVAAQIAQARSIGLQLTHLDSHNDVHTMPSLARTIAEVAQAHAIPRVRPARNCGSRQGRIRWLFHRRYNETLTGLGLKHVDYFGTVDDLLSLDDSGPTRSPFFGEAMTHPKLNAEGSLVVDAPCMLPLASRVRQLENRGFSFAGPLSLCSACD